MFADFLGLLGVADELVLELALFADGLLDPPNALMGVVRAKTVGDAAKVCKENQKQPATCSDICSIADAICDNAENICGLADELGKNDTYAQEKCTSAKASCSEAKQRCCGCSDDTQAPSGAP